MIHQHENWTFRDPAEITAAFSNNDVAINCSFTQFTPNTPVFEGLTGITLIDCTNINTDYPPTTTVDGGNTAIIDYEEEPGKPGRVKEVTQDMVRGKKNYPKPTKSRLDDIWSSDEITNISILVHNKKKIKKAKEAKKIKKVK